MQRMLLLLGLVILIAYGFQEDDPPLPEPMIEDPKLSRTELSGEYSELLLHEIRKEYLVNKTGINEDLASRIVSAAREESLSHNLDADLIISLIIVESAGNPKAVSPVGAVGLMQVMPGTGKYIARVSNLKWSGVEKLRAVESNISYGTWYYRYLLSKFEGGERIALAAYNWGPGNIRVRLKQGKKLPKIYPNKVYKIKQELSGVIWNEYNTRFWRGVDQYIRDAHERADSERSAS